MFPPNHHRSYTRTTGKGTPRETGMNKTEARYAACLDAYKSAGQILWYRYEGMKFRLANNTFYTPDFVVMTRDGTIEVHEVKGFWEDDARVKIKVAAEMYPFIFRAFKSSKGGWSEEVI